MNVILVGLTLLVLAAVLISCVALGSDRLSAARYASRDGIEVPPPARGPLEGPEWEDRAWEDADEAGAAAHDAGPHGPGDSDGPHRPGAPDVPHGSDDPHRPGAPDGRGA